MSIVSDKISRYLGCKNHDSKTLISTPLSDTKMSCSKCDIGIVLPDGNKENCKFNVINNFEMKVKIPNMMKRIEIAIKDNVPIATSIPEYKNDSIAIDGIIGIDVIPKLKVFELIRINDVPYFRLSNGFIPVGPVNPIIHKKIKRMNKEPQLYKENDVNTLLNNRFSKLPDLCTNVNSKGRVKNIRCNKSATSPKEMNLTNTVSQIKKYSSPKPSAKEIKYAERVIVNTLRNENDYVKDEIERSLISLESIGIDSKTSQYDDDIIKKFKQDITIENGRYNIVLPWDKETLSKVPSHFVLAKILAKKAMERAKRDGILESYENVFEEQLNNGIIEPISVDENFNPEHYKWIPHHPVIKNEESTTKLRVVLNCAFRTKNNPSINDAAYAGVDLVNDLLGILNYARTNNYLVIGDIEKAFHQVKLKTAYDRNKFCVLLYQNGEYKAYRYTRIIFGYQTSPFILSYLLGHLANQCHNAEISNIIANKFYVDNLCFTFNNSDQAAELIGGTRNKLAEVGFPLREFASNNKNILKKLTLVKKGLVTQTP